MRDDGLIAFLRARLDEDEAYGSRPLGPGRYPNVFEGHEPGALKRVRREVAMKRAMLAELTRWPFDYRADCDDPTRLFVRLLGAAYSDHPEYRAEWKPEPFTTGAPAT